MNFSKKLLKRAASATLAAVLVAQPMMTSFGFKAGTSVESTSLPLFTNDPSTADALKSMFLDVRDPEYYSAVFYWNCNGNLTEVQPITGTVVPPKSLPRSIDEDYNVISWWDGSTASTGHTGSSLTPRIGYSTTPGSSYRLTNIGMIPATGEMLDVIITVKDSVRCNTNFPGKVYFVNSSDWDDSVQGLLGSDLNSLGIWLNNTSWIDFDYQIVKHGTNEGENLQFMSYFWDIDFGQSIKEDLGSLRTIFHDPTELRTNADGTVWSRGGRWEDATAHPDYFYDPAAYITHTKMAKGQHFDIKYAAVGGGWPASQKPVEPLINNRLPNGEKVTEHDATPSRDAQQMLSISEYNDIWFLQFGRFERMPPAVTELAKTVSDLNENSFEKVNLDVSSAAARRQTIQRLKAAGENNPNHLGLIDRDQRYYLSFAVDKGTSSFKKLSILDSVANTGGTLVPQSARIVNAANKDITNLFTCTYNNNVFHAALNPDQLDNDDLMNTIITVSFDIKGVRWLGDTFDNTATLDTGYHNRNDGVPAVITSNVVRTTIPQNGVVEKYVSVDESASSARYRDGANYVKAEDPDAAEVPTERYRSADYTWKNEYTLPNLTDYTALQLRDVFEDIQSINHSDVHVYNDKGDDITNRGTLEIVDANQAARANYSGYSIPNTPTDRLMVTWTADKHELNDLNTLNKEYGKASKKHPHYTMKITTRVTPENMTRISAKYIRPSGEVVIPNIAGYSAKDDSGAGYYHQDSNWSHVKLRPGVRTSPMKFVSDHNENTVDENHESGTGNAHTGLVDRNVMYTITIPITAGADFSEFTITDQLSPHFKTNRDRVTVVNSENRNVTDLFEKTLDENNLLTLRLTEDGKKSQELKNTTLSVYIKGVADRWISDNGGIVNNTATVDNHEPNHLYKTPEIKFAIPEDGEVTKSNSTTAQDYTQPGEDGGNYGRNFTNYLPASTMQTANQVAHYDDNYEWRTDFKLPNLTQYHALQLVDQFRSVQALDTSEIRIYWADNADANENLAGFGTFDVQEKNGIKTVTWTANQAMLDNMNARYGKSSTEHPVFSMYIPTNIRNSNKEDIKPYVNAATQDIYIPNDSYFIVDDDSGINNDHIGRYTKSSNTSWVKVAAKIPDIPQLPPDTPDPKIPPTTVPKLPPTFDEKGKKYYIPPVKMVSDSDERLVSRNNVGLTKRDMSYTVKFETTPGTHFNTLRIYDRLPKEFTTTLDQIQITNGRGENVTDRFDCVLNDNEFIATVKEKSANDPAIKGTVLTTVFTGTAPRWLGGKFKNGASVTDEYHTYYTNFVETRDPSEPKVKKSVSIDNGKNYAEAPTHEAAPELTRRPDRYRWKMDYTLSNYSLFTEITLGDLFESVQTVTPEDIHVYDFTGKEVTNRGDLTIGAKVPGGASDIIWKAKRELVEETNRTFGPESDKIPTFTMTIDTDVKAALNLDESKYYDAALDRIVIPNEGWFIESDAEGSVTTRSNKSHVRFPKPGEPNDPNGPSVTKRVSLADKNDWQTTLELPDYNQLYDYKTAFKLSYNHNYDAGDLKLVDRFENVQEYKSIQIFEGEDMKDVTDQFEIGVSAARPGATESEPLEIRAIPKNQDDWDDTGKTLYMVIKGVKLVGTPDRMIDYLEDNPETPFTEGVTIPNQSYLHEGHAVVSWVRKTDSNKTYVNFVAKPKMEKWVEDDNMVVFDPKTASIEAADLKDMVGLSQYILTEMLKKDPTLINSQEYFKLRTDLLNPVVTKQELREQLAKLYKLKLTSPVRGTTE